MGQNLKVGGPVNLRGKQQKHGHITVIHEDDTASVEWESDGTDAPLERLPTALLASREIRLAASQSFNSPQIDLLDTIFKSLLHGRPLLAVTRHPQFAPLFRKIEKMKRRVEVVKAGKAKIKGEAKA